MKNPAEWLVPLMSVIRMVKGVGLSSQRSCPICGYTGGFLAAGRPPRLDARCPRCRSLERHRLFWLWLANRAEKLQEPILHFAAEDVLEHQFRKLYHEYSTADLYKPADRRVDIERISLPAGSVKTIVCNHVLEHVADRAALKGMYQVLSAGGCLVVSVPIVEGWEHTYENASVKKSKMRQLHFGQEDHVRYYGRDFRVRLRDAGFEITEEITAEGEAVVKYGLLRGEKVFICRKAEEQ